MKTTQTLRDGKWSIETHISGTGEPLLFLHGANGMLPVEPWLDELARDYRVIAPHLPGFGDSTGPELVDDVLDASLFYHELMDDLGIASAHVIGHSMGGMIAAELAALCSHRVKKLVLVAPAGFWLDEHPIPDFFAAQLDELAPMLFADPNCPAAKMMTTIPSDLELLGAMYVERTKRLAMASKFLWPIPERGFKKRAFRIKSPTLLIWGDSDRLISPVYAREFLSHVKGAKLATIKSAGHLPMYEQQTEFLTTVRSFLKG